MVSYIQDFTCEKDVKCPNCGCDMKIIVKSKGKSIYECVNCKYKIY